MPRFCKSSALQTLDAKAYQIAHTQGFNRQHGTAQLDPTRQHEDLIKRAVEYGRMRAFEEFACLIEDGQLESA